MRFLVNEDIGEAFPLSVNLNNEHILYRSRDEAIAGYLKDKMDSKSMPLPEVWIIRYELTSPERFAPIQEMLNLLKENMETFAPDGFIESYTEDIIDADVEGELSEEICKTLGEWFDNYLTVRSFWKYFQVSRVSIARDYPDILSNFMRDKYTDAYTGKSRDKLSNSKRTGEDIYNDVINELNRWDSDSQLAKVLLTFGYNTPYKEYMASLCALGNQTPFGLVKFIVEYRDLYG